MSPQEPVHHTCQVQPWRLIRCPTQDLLHISQNQRSDARLGCFSSGLVVCPQPIKQICVTARQRTAVNKGHESGLTVIGSCFTEMFILRNDRCLTYSSDSHRERMGNSRVADVLWCRVRTPDFNDDMFLSRYVPQAICPFMFIYIFLSLSGEKYIKSV